jgi:hypothetical protein
MCYYGANVQGETYDYGRYGYIMDIYVWEDKNTNIEALLLQF